MNRKNIENLKYYTDEVYYMWLLALTMGEKEKPKKFKVVFC